MKPLLSICLCTVGNLEYLKILLRGIKRHTEVPYEVCIHVNGCVSTMDWLMSLEMDNLKVSWSENNEGCAAVNYAVGLADGEYIYNFNDDMYPLPGYDTMVLDMLRERKTLSTIGIGVVVAPGIIEPNPYYPDVSLPIRLDAGDKSYNFDEDKLLGWWSTNREIVKSNNPNTIDHMHPFMCHKDLWNDIGGIDADYFPGWASDLQFAYDVLERDGLMMQCGAARVYHFSGKALQKDPNRVKLCSDGVNLFKKKTGMSIEKFQKWMRKGEVITGNASIV